MEIPYGREGTRVGAFRAAVGSRWRAGRGVLCSDESTFVTDDLAQCLCCVFLANVCAYGASLDVCALGQPSQQGFSEVLVRFLS